MYRTKFKNKIWIILFQNLKLFIGIYILILSFHETLNLCNYYFYLIFTMLLFHYVTVLFYINLTIMNHGNLVLTITIALFNKLLEIVGDCLETAIK